MIIAEEITQIFQNIWAWFASFTDIGDMFLQFIEGIGDFFVRLWNGLMG